MQEKYNISTGNKSPETVEQFKYLGTTLTKQSPFDRNQGQIETREFLLSLGTECFFFKFSIQKYKN
jgi:hypothetical protein